MCNAKALEAEIDKEIGRVNDILHTGKSQSQQKFLFND